MSRPTKRQFNVTWWDTDASDALHGTNMKYGFVLSAVRGHKMFRSILADGNKSQNMETTRARG